MSIRNWREWFVPAEEVTSEVEQSDQVSVESGAGHRDENFKKLSLKRKLPPRCAKCKRFMGPSDGMYVIISGGWRAHIWCFATVLERHFENGETLDPSTGGIIEVNTLKNREVDDS